jgi:hypothetical protein
MSFAVACREADKRQRRQPKDRRLERLRRLLTDDVSLVEACYALNVVPHRAAASTVAALMYSLRNGVAALKQSSTLSQLSELSEAQLREVAIRVQKFEPRIAPAWMAKDVEVLLATWSKVHG